jgi:micrococcal nuclease
MELSNICCNFVYKINVLSVYDGDTITCDINLGFNVVLKNQKIRLYGINSPEIRGGRDPSTGIVNIDTKKKAIESRDYLKNKILNNNDLYLKTINDKKDKYGRWLGIIYLNNENINEQMILNGFALKYII